MAKSGTWTALSPSGELAAFGSRRFLRQWVKEHPGWRSLEYPRRISHAQARRPGISRSEARGHPYWEPIVKKRRAHPTARDKHQKPERILIGRPDRNEPLPLDALRRGVRKFRRRYPDATSVMVAVFGRPKREQNWGYISPKLAKKMRQARFDYYEAFGRPMPEPEYPPVWGGRRIAVADLVSRIEGASSSEDALSFAEVEAVGMPGWQAVYQVELSA